VAIFTNLRFERFQPRQMNQNQRVLLFIRELGNVGLGRGLFCQDLHGIQQTGLTKFTIAPLQLFALNSYLDF